MNLNHLIELVYTMSPNIGLCIQFAHTMALIQTCKTMIFHNFFPLFLTILYQKTLADVLLRKIASITWKSFTKTHIIQSYKIRTKKSIHIKCKWNIMSSLKLVSSLVTKKTIATQKTPSSPRHQCQATCTSTKATIIGNKQVSTLAQWVNLKHISIEIKHTHTLYWFMQ